MTCFPPQVHAPICLNMTHAFIWNKIYCTSHTHIDTSVSVIPTCNCVMEQGNEHKEHLHSEIIIHHVLMDMKHLKMEVRHKLGSIKQVTDVEVISWNKGSIILWCSQRTVTLIINTLVKMDM